LRPAFDFLFFGKGLTGFGLLIGTLYSSPTLFALIGCKRSRIIADYLGLTIETVSSLKKHSKPARPVDLGVIGKEHFYRLMEAAGGDPRTFTYNRSFGETNGIPRVTEFAFGIHGEGLRAGRGPSRKVITGVNWSPGINNPFRYLGRGGVGLDAILSEVRANTSQPAIAVLNLACPRVAYTDRGKSAIVVEGEVKEDSDDEEEE
jgi:hypothetical protein